MAKMKRFVSITIVILMLLVCFPTNATAEGRKQDVTRVDVNLRKQPTMSNQPYFVEVPKGKSVDAYLRFSTTEGEFEVVSYDGYVGFVPTKYLTTATAETAKLGKIKTICAVNQRIKPEKSNASYYSEIPKDAIVEAYDALVKVGDGSYWLCFYHGKWGFVPSQYANWVETNSSVTTETPQPIEDKKVTTTLVPLDLRLDSFIYGAKVICEIPKGAEVVTLSNSFVSDDGYSITKVFYNGNFGYVKSQYLKEANVTTMTVREEQSAYALNLRNNPSENYDTFCEIPANTKFYVLQEESGYKLVSYDGFLGYVPSRFGYGNKTYNVLDAATTKGGTGDRMINIRLACKKLTGTVLSNQEEFSWFARHGQCLAVNGYVYATSFAGGGTIQDIGGGVCQVSSTINIVARRCGIQTDAVKHVCSVSYCNRCDEATVSYPYTNFTFTNNTGKRITLLLYQNDSSNCTVLFLVN